MCVTAKGISPLLESATKKKKKKKKFGLALR